MDRLNVSHYRCYVADNRMSMGIYADSLVNSIDHDSFKLTNVTPQSRLERFSQNKFIIRYLRYMHYPNFVRGNSADIHHVLDHGYAHIHQVLNQGRTCITVHDLIPMLHWLGEIRGSAATPLKPRKPVLNIRSLSYLDRYDHIIAISNSTKRDIIKNLNITPEKISVIPPVIAEHFKPVCEAPVARLQKKYQLNQQCKWLMISGNEFYKNHHASLIALKELNRHSEVPFCIIKTGRQSKEFDQLLIDHELVQSVRSIYLENISELVALYSFVDCLVFPSLYEGFGMPVAEALACGTPVVMSNRGALPEVGGDLVPQCDASDGVQLARNISRVVFETGYRRRISEQGPEWVEQFRADTVGPKIEAVYRSLVNNDKA